jgi:CRP-like cAMP-binding protein
MPPECVLEAFEESAARYAVRYRLVNTLPDDVSDSEMRKRIWYALHRHDIEIPFPAMNVFLTELNQERKQRKSDKELRRRLSALAMVNIFAPLSDEERGQLAAALRHEIFGQGEVILNAGESGDSIYLIRNGLVSVQIEGAPGKGRTEVAMLREGAFFGEMSLMTGEPRSATVVAKEDTDCYVLDHASFQEVLLKKEGLAQEISRLLAERGQGLQLKREGISAAQEVEQHQQALLSRIRQFFGLR